MEVWKPIKGYEDLYEVSNQGRIRSKDKIRRIGTGKGYDKLFPSKILSTSINNCGYKIIILKKPGSKIICKTVHRLVAEAFIPNPLNLSDINHKDENKLNNCVENLEWMSHSDNLKYGTCRSRQTMSTRRSEVQKIARKLANGWIPPIFKWKKRYAVIYQGERYVPEGKVGELVLTTINREGMPLLRYRTRDLTRILRSDPADGRHHRPGQGFPGQGCQGQGCRSCCRRRACRCPRCQC